VVIVALSVAKSGAAHLPLVAVVVIAVAIKAGAGVIAGSAGITPARAGTGMAIHVITALAAAEGVSLGTPPPADQTPRGTGVDTAGIHTEIRPTVIA
jgi:hypothetical protein